MYTYENGDVFSGSFNGRKPHGHGFIVQGNGDTYEGGEISNLTFRFFP